MRFPGHRIAKHYFPVSRRKTRIEPRPRTHVRPWYLVGVDQVLVDMEVHNGDELAAGLGLQPGESIGLGPAEFGELVARIQEARLPVRYAPGGTVANTLNNYSHLAGEPAVLLGAIEDSIRVGSPAFGFVAQTSKAVDLTHLHAVEGTVGTAVTFISSNGERSFAVAPGVSNDFGEEHVPEDVVRNAGAVVASLYTFRNESWPIAQATRRVMKIAGEAGVPVAFGLGTAGLVRELRPAVRELLREHVTIAAMNDREAEALTGYADPLLACRRILEWVDLVIVTEGPQGLTIGGYVDQAHKRKTRYEVWSKALPEYNQWEFSRLMLRADCADPIKIYTHIHPFRGGPSELVNTNGAGDAALAAVLHDVAANRYHQGRVPDSAKHRTGTFLTYSSLRRMAQYGNRVAYEVLRGYSPRLEAPVGPDDKDPEAPEPVPPPGEVD